MSKIVVSGSEEFSLGFELVGIEYFDLKNLESLIYDSSHDVGVVILEKESYDELSVRMQAEIKRIIRPIVVILSKEDVKGDSLRDEIIKTMGVDLMK